MSSQNFQTLKELPIPLNQVQYVLHKHEILICGGYGQRACYSYHTIKNEYKFVCEYPRHVQLHGHCVVKLVDNNNNKDRNQVTLLSFGSSSFGLDKHTLVMKYLSVWSNDSSKSNEFNNYNKWIPFTDNRNHPIIIGRNKDCYIGARAVIGGSKSHLLFITYKENDISVFDLNTFQFIKHATLPTVNRISYHCFISNSENGQGQEMIKTKEEKNKQNYKMLLFCFKTGLSIEYDEDNNTIQFHNLHVCDDIAPLSRYAYVYVNDIILFFGGANYPNISKSLHKYLIRENKWTTLQNYLPIPLYDCVAILSEEDNHVYIIGGRDDTNMEVSTHTKTKLRVCDPSLLVMICLFVHFNETQINCIV
ncbi:hypothetical protein RFI_03262 [Reticulomyxa filosa]|uniref:Kelch motif family protein n=1 Tax=Reticulomyxa filosa TaxID=46433 RepID=X6P5L2_RETFI|nr:hypothetical protein RFI_03262 [Reticulomyxa filosa]|eukprot:ETO33840.1 hypothetical protein RFI_03262 [Reticulomyxa filosa]